MIFTNIFIISIAIVGPLSLCVAKQKGRLQRSWCMVTLTALALMMVCILTGHKLLTAMAREVSVNWSPDRNYRVIVFAVPYSSVVPGSGSDGPGFAELYDVHDELLGSASFEMIQGAQITWFDGFVEIGSEMLDLN